MPMPVKKKQVLDTPKASLSLPRDMCFSNNIKRPMGWFRKGMDDCVWIFGRRLESEQLKELSDWARKAAEYIDSKDSSKVK